MPPSRARQSISVSRQGPSSNNNDNALTGSRASVDISSPG